MNSNSLPPPKASTAINLAPGLTGIIFSKDRPLQLDATLRSMDLHCGDASSTRRVVLYTTTSPRMESLYRQCAVEHPTVEFVQEREFKSDVLRIVTGSKYVLFLVDDNLFVREFSLGEVCDTLQSLPPALGFSLRLGRNTVYCYAMDAPQPLPAFESLTNGICAYRWPDAALDFNYPLEVSSSVYRTHEILPLVTAIQFHNPNTFEALLAQNAGAFLPQHDHLLCFERSVTFCAPINKVQTTYDNRSGGDPSGSVARLAEVYAAGIRLDVAVYSGFTPRACHMEIAFELPEVLPVRSDVMSDTGSAISQPAKLPVESDTVGPVVSVVIPCYNKAKYLREAVESVVAQSYPRWECIIVDDESPDATEATARDLINEFAGHRITYIRKKNGGPSSARNAGIERSTAELILPLDADDRIDRRMLELTVQRLQAEPHVDIVYTDTQRFGDVDMRCRTGPWDLGTMKKGNVLNYCALYRKYVWQSVGGYDEVLTPGYEDWEFWLKCLKQGFRAAKIPEFLFHYRVQSDSLFAAARRNDGTMRAEIHQRHPDLFVDAAQDSQPHKKILFVLHSYLPEGLGGVEVYTHALAQELIRRGRDVRVLIPGFEAHQRAGVLEEGMVNGVPVARLHLGPLPDLRGTINNQHAGELFEQYLDRFRPDVVHFQHLMGFTAACADAARRRNIPTFFTVHDAWMMCEQSHLMHADGSFCADGPSSPERCAACVQGRHPGEWNEKPLSDLEATMVWRKRIHQNAFQGFRAVFVPTAFMAEKLSSCGFTHPKMMVRPLGLPAFERLIPLGSSPTVRLTYLGNICHTKGLDLLICALQQLDGVDLQLDIYGRVLQPAYLEQLKGYIPGGVKIQYHGPYSPEDRGRILSGADLTVIPSRSENYSTTARESLHAGVPVIAANVGGMSEIVIDGKNGRIYPSENVEALAEILRSLAGNREERARLREGIESVYSIEQDADALESEYRHNVASGVSIVIVTYNSEKSIQRCLDRVLACAVAPFEVVVVDNASHDGTGRILNGFGDRIRVIRNETNVGFSRACNQGITQAAGDYIILLNPDTEVTPGWIDRMTAHFRPDVGAVGPVSNYVAADQKAELYLDDRHVLSESPDRIGSILATRNNGRGVETRLLIGFCLMIPRAVLHQCGGLDEDLFLGNDDLEISWRLRQKGLKLVVATDVFVHHTGQESFRTEVPEKTRRLVQESTDRLFAKLERHYGRNRVPSPEELWGINWFTPSRRSTVSGKVSIVILTYDQIDHTRRCVDSLERCTAVDHELVFVDNGSKDGTIGWLRKFAKTRPYVTLIENKKNLGFARGCNQGIKASTGEYILLLNNDVVVTPEWISGLLECHRALERPGIVGPMTNSAGSIQKVPAVGYSGPADLDAYAAEFRRQYRHRKVVTQHLAGFCMLFARSLVDEIGLLDESFETGNFEDDDLCLRAALRGYENVIAGDVFIHHVGSASFSGNAINYASVYSMNRRLFQEKWRKVSPRSPEGMNLTALELLHSADEKEQRGDRDGAMETLRGGISRFPDSPRLNSELAWMLLRGKKFEDAARFLEHVPEAVKKHQEWLEIAGFAMYGLGEQELAAQCADRSLGVNPHRPNALLLKGMLAADQSDEKNAEEWFLKATELDSSNGEPWAHLAAISWRRGDQEKAFQQIERAFVLSPTHSDIAATFAYAAREMDALDCLTARAMDAAALHPFHKATALLLAEALIGLQAWEQGLAALTTVLGQFSLDDETLTNASVLRDRVGPYVSERGSPSISLCMIVRDEEETLPRCLAAATRAVDEIIVVDTGSTDRSMKVAHAMGAKVLSFEWNDDFSAARNCAIEEATGDWILVLDADEVLSPADHGSLRALISGPGCRKAFSFVTRNYVTAMDLQGWRANAGHAVEEAGSGWVPSSKVRLFPRDADIRFMNPVHEVVEPVLSRMDIPVVSCTIPIHHYGRLDDRKVREKGERYAVLGWKRLEEGREDDQRMLLDLAAQEQELGHHERAIDLWVRHLERYPNDAHGYLGLGASLSAMGSHEGALGPLKKAMELDPGLREAPVKYALSLLHLGHAAEAKALLEKVCLQADLYPIALTVLSAVYACAGERDSARRIVSELDRQQIQCDVFYRNLATELEVSGQYDFARALTETFSAPISIPVSD